VYSGSTGNWTLASHKRFVYDNYQQIEELDALNSNGVAKKRIWGQGKIICDIHGSTAYYALGDANKNITEYVDSVGTIQAHYEYSPFGKITVSNGAMVDDFDYRFSSEVFDDETGLVYYNYRYYSPELGRWLTCDPIGENGGYNLYAMVGNNAVNMWDRLGNGSFIVSVAPKESRSGKQNASLIHISFAPSEEDMKCCSSFSLVQFVKTDFANPLSSDRNWHIDGKADPAYNGQSHKRGCTLEDDPGITSIYGGVQYFETCAYCTSGKDEGKLLGCITWTVFTNTDYTRQTYIDGRKPNKKGGYDYCKPKIPSENAEKILDKWKKDKRNAGLINKVLSTSLPMAR
jgi:RHS repeat-associated protein